MTPADATKPSELSRSVTTRLPQTLRWVTTGQEFDDVERRFAQRVSDALRTFLARLQSEAPSLVDALSTRLAQASDDTVKRLLLSPNVSQRLLWGTGDAAEFGRLLDDYLRLEAAEHAPERAAAAPFWGPLGDRVAHGDELVRWDPVDGRLAVDLHSPDAIAVGPSSPSEASGWTALEASEQREALDALAAAYRCVRGASPSLAALMDVCARVVVVRKKHSREFASFSSCYFVGRIAIVNPQLVNDVLIAEALVHEAVHSYLYMDEPAPLWGLAPGVCGDPGMVHSPWTGRALPVCTFLHACFVWYALLFFWARVLRSPQPQVDDIRRRIARASFGFMQGDVLEQLGPGRVGLVRDDVRAALAEMQDTVLAARVG